MDFSSPYSENSDEVLPTIDEEGRFIHQWFGEYYIVHSGAGTHPWIVRRTEGCDISFWAKFEQAQEDAEHLQFKLEINRRRRSVRKLMERITKAMAKVQRRTLGEEYPEENYMYKKFVMHFRDAMNTKSHMTAQYIGMLVEYESEIEQALAEMRITQLRHNLQDALKYIAQQSLEFNIPKYQG